MTDPVSEAQTLPGRPFGPGAYEHIIQGWHSPGREEQGAGLEDLRQNKRRGNQMRNGRKLQAEVTPQPETATPKNTELWFSQECAAAHIQSRMAWGLLVRVNKEDHLSNITIGF